MPLRGSPLSRLRREGGTPSGLAKPVPRVRWGGLLRGLRIVKEALHESSGKWALRIGMGCKAQTAAIALAIARICNAADRPSPQMHTAR